MGQSNQYKQTNRTFTLNQDRIPGIIFTTPPDTTEKLEKTYEMIFKTLDAGKKKSDPPEMGNNKAKPMSCSSLSPEEKKALVDTDSMLLNCISYV